MSDPLRPASIAPDAPNTGRTRSVPILAMLGARLVSEKCGLAAVQLGLRADLLNKHSGGHGGVAMRLLDSAMANTALSNLYPRANSRTRR